MNKQELDLTIAGLTAGCTLNPYLLKSIYGKTTTADLSEFGGYESAYEQDMEKGHLVEKHEED